MPSRIAAFVFLLFGASYIPFKSLGAAVSSCCVPIFTLILVVRSQSLASPVSSLPPLSNARNTTQVANQALDPPLYEYRSRGYDAGDGVHGERGCMGGRDARGDGITVTVGVALWNELDITVTVGVARGN